MSKNLTLKTTDGKDIIVDITDSVCWNFGFFHGEIAFNPKKDEKVKIMGVAPGNDGDLRLWYSIDHSKIMGQVCYWGGKKNLSDEGFILPQLEITHLYPSEIPEDPALTGRLPYFIKRSGKFFSETDKIPLFPSDLKHWVNNGEVKELKSPIMLSHTESLFIGSGNVNPVVYARDFISKVKNFRRIGMYKDIIL